MKRAVIIIFSFFIMNAMAKEERINVPSDPKAKYYLLEENGQGNERIILTKRVGKSGESFSKRLYNCSDNTFKYLGDGDTIEEMESSKEDKLMSALVEGSISYHIGIKACKK